MSAEDNNKRIARTDSQQPQHPLPQQVTMTSTKPNDKTKKIKVLHVLSQRPGRTGSGVTIEALVRHANEKGYECYAVVGTPVDDPMPTIADLPNARIFPVLFGPPNVDGTDGLETVDQGVESSLQSQSPLRPPPPRLPFLLPGMSDIMPYESSVWSQLTDAQIDLYKSVWKEHLKRVIFDWVQPDLIHSHHIWIVSSLLRDIIVVPSSDDDDTSKKCIPIVTHCHATGLRQMEKCRPHLKQQAVQGCRRNDRFVVLHGMHQQELAACLDITSSSTDDRIHIVGAGYRQDVFYCRSDYKNNEILTSTSAQPSKPSVDLVFAGKISRSKGLPWLLDALEQLQADSDYMGIPNTTITLHVAGSGSGSEADELTRRMQEEMGCQHLNNLTIKLHGMLSQEQLADLLRQSDIFVLPSLYEGLPLVLVEAAACGCRLICTALPGVLQQLYEPLQHIMELVPLPRCVNVDEPMTEDIPAFVESLKHAIGKSIQDTVVVNDSRDGAASMTRHVHDLSAFTKHFTWQAVFDRVEKIWLEMLAA